MVTLLPSVELHPASTPESSVIWLHGLGADGHDFVPAISNLGLEDKQIRYIFPHAPLKPFTLNEGRLMTAWFDVTEAGKERSYNAEQLLASVALVQGFIDREIERGMKTEQIFIAGFSQGGATAIHAALTYDKPLAGLIALSTWFPTADVIEIHPANAKLPILLCHGDEDRLLPPAMAHNTRCYMEDFGLEPTCHNYPMSHQVCDVELKDIGTFLRARC